MVLVFLYVFDIFVMLRIAASAGDKQQNDKGVTPFHNSIFDCDFQCARRDIKHDQMLGYILLVSPQCYLLCDL